MLTMRQGIRMSILTAVAFLLVGSTGPATSRNLIIEGQIVSYECGDNCYLTIRTRYGKNVVGLCAARECAKWNDQAKMPAKLLGRSIEVMIDKGTRVDGNLDKVDEFPAFSKLRFLK